ncbi:cytidine deaminase [Enterobacillus tribolii]|uniref:Cytidine deaminase n=1 Tax=Enterobacillus tribolii TaxID=1487935 RepID=A0A370QMX5_9GAMM|nr:cytidine deaminase [Enterobacillus tribolii]MBW7982221.1 cytidine deaminase [Enterobacillus tribolii]RDK89390.1 cytidine deaminase [Enterobacillus tribolii]
MHARFTAAFSQLSAALQTALAPLLEQDEFPAFLTAAQAEAVKQASGLDDDALAFALLPLAAACSLAPVSEFFVGAVARGLSGNLYFGANMEFAGTPLQQTIHAEQCAVTHAWMRGERGLASITVNYTPCGHCRQFMNELNSGTGLTIRLPGRAPATLGDYLPDAFGPRDLNITTLLMDETRHGLSSSNQDPLTQQAVAAADQSHAPYSRSYSGVALEAEDGAVFTGRYAENAAFNPSLPPLQAALILMNLSGRDLRHIRRAVLAETQGSLLTQWPATQATLLALGCKNSEHHLL